MTMHPQDRSLIARIASHTSWAKTTDRAARTAPARAAFLDRFERQVDPDGTLPPDERARRADHARRAYFSALALRSAQARRTRRTPRRPAASAPPQHRTPEEPTPTAATPHRHPGAGRAAHRPGAAG